MAMTRITVSLDDDIVAWARAQAARKSMAVGRFLGEVIMKQMHEWRRLEEAARRGLAEYPPRLEGPGRSA